MTSADQHPVLELVEAQRAGCTDKQLDVLRRRGARHSKRRIARDLGISVTAVNDRLDAAYANIKRYHDLEEAR